MPVSLHHIVIDAHDLLGLARFWSQVLDWPILSEREREVVIGPADDAAVGICFMPSPDDKVVKNRVHLDLSPGPTTATANVNRRSNASSPSGHDPSTSVNEATRRGRCSLIQRATSSASFARIRP